MEHLDNVRQARASLAVLFEPGDQLRDLVAAHGPVDTFNRLRDGSLPLTGLRSEVRRVPEQQLWAAVARVVAEEAGGRIVIPEDDDWPTGLADLAAMPDFDADVPAVLCLWVRGDLPVAAAMKQSVTVTGARAATSYGEIVANELGHGLAVHGWSVAAGGAYGVDAAAHRGALVGEGITVAVLPCGLDRLYPTANASLLNRIADTGLLISMWPPGIGPVRARMAATRTLLAALTEGTVVVEAARRSGALTVLRHTIALGRAAMVVPGPVSSAVSAGCHDALREDSRVLLVTGVADVLAELDAHAAPA
jgi:DNA processing protein